MKIIDALNKQPGRFEIPDCTRGDLPAFFVEMGYKVGAEIGVYKGEYTAQFLKEGLYIYGIDPWMVYPDYNHKRGKNMDKQEFLYNLTKENLAPYPNHTLVRKTSMDALADFKDESLDFVYIDGHHSFKYVAEDIWEWSKKVRPGGTISGHDYWVPANKELESGPLSNHVKYVVDAYVEALQIKNWYVLGRNKKQDGERLDRWRSWMWIRK